MVARSQKIALVRQAEQNHGCTQRGGFALHPTIDFYTFPVNAPATQHQSNDQRDIVVYDNDCGFCQSQMQRLKRMDRHGRFNRVPRNDPELLDTYPQLKHHDFNTGIRVIKPDGRVLVAADAVYEMARQLPKYRWIAWLYRVPGLKQIARFIYNWIARHRHRLGQTHCEIDPNDSSSRG